MLKKYFSLAVIGAALAGCNNTQPVGGQGYFDAPFVVPQTPTVLVPLKPAVEVDMTTSLSNAVEAAIAESEAAEIPLPTTVAAPLPTTATAPLTAIVAPPTSVVAEVVVAQADTQTDQNNISTDDGSLDLNAETFAEQEAKRNAAAAALAAARDQLVIIEPGTLPDVVAGVNIAQFARTTKNAVGEQLYRRPIIKNRFSSAECRKFQSADDAQRNFLANGGPEKDPLNLDPDGDGFACKWSPEVYRLLQ